jgi:hypothetical protein
MTAPNKMPPLSPGPFMESNESREDSKLWHVYYNHSDGLGAACRAKHGCFTIAPTQVTCSKCLEVLKEESK